MNRRHLLGVLGAAVASPVLSRLSADELLALGRSVHARAAHRALRVLDPRAAETVATIAHLIIPETDTPGARAARVQEFIDLIVAEWYDEDERRRFRDGIADVDARSRRAGGRDFVSLADAQQVQLLRQLDAEVAALRAAGENADRHFFQQIKWLTLYGYYTSEVGVTQELKERVVPGRYDPCVATGIAPRRGR